MTKTSCIRHPAKHSSNKNPLVVHQWQIIACHGDYKQAVVLSYFEAKLNAVIELHEQGEGASSRPQETLFRTKLSTLRDELLGIASERTLSKALDSLAALEFITIQSNPDHDAEKTPDRTKYIRFHPEACTAWINAHYNSDGSLIDPTEAHSAKRKSPFDKSSEWAMQDGSSHSAKVQNGQDKTLEWEKQKESKITQLADYSEKQTDKSPFCKSSESHIYNQYQSIQSINSIKQNENIGHSDFEKQKQTESIGQHINSVSVVNALVEQGFVRDRFDYADAIPTVERLIQSGATIETFLQAYETSVLATKGKGFGVNYLARVVETLLKKANKPTALPTRSKKKPSQSVKQVKEYVYENNLKNAESWAGDLI